MQTINLENFKLHKRQENEHVQLSFCKSSMHYATTPPYAEPIKLYSFVLRQRSCPMSASLAGTEWFPFTGHLLPAKLCAEHFIESSLPPIYGVGTAPILILQMTHLRLRGSSDPGSHTQPISSRAGAKGLYDSKTWAYRCDSQIR